MSEDVCHYEYVLDNDFFISIDAPEIQKGKLRVALTVKKSMGVFVLNFHTEGFVVVPCDRCLDDMEIPVDIDDELKVKMGATFSDENDIVVVPEEDGYINVAWFIYEFIALSLPMKHVHAPGKCNKAMSSKLKKHTARSTEDGDEEYEDDSVEEDIAIDDDVPVATDPRWDGLKGLLENDNN